MTYNIDVQNEKVHHECAIEIVSDSAKIEDANNNPRMMFSFQKFSKNSNID